MVEFRKAIKKDRPQIVGVEERTEPIISGPVFPRELLDKRHVTDRSAQDLYLEGLALAAASLEWAAGDTSSGFPLLKPLDSLTNDICNWLDSEQAWKLLCMNRASSEPSYIPSHLMNVCILSTYLALRSGISSEQTHSLSKIAFLHDIGMARVKPVWNTKERLTAEQFAPIKDHPLETLKLIDETGCCEEPGAVLAAVEHHERLDGSGYPRKKTGGQISALSHILSVADIYTGMTHKRLFRDALKPFDAVRAISHLAGSSLQTEAARMFLQRMSIYPVGSGVRLNNGVLARVIASNEKQLTRPILQVISSENENFEPNQIVELNKEKLLFVREPVCLGPLDPVFNIG